MYKYLVLFYTMKYCFHLLNFIYVDPISQIKVIFSFNDTKKAFFLSYVFFAVQSESEIRFLRSNL